MMAPAQAQHHKLTRGDKSKLDEGIIAEFHKLEDPQLGAKLFGERTAPEMLLPVLGGRKASEVIKTQRTGNSRNPGERTLKFPGSEERAELKRAA
jgi:hypothetical protein